ncbi:hypothetical protein [Glycomyces tenuis]|uniref:hypothetical protein n=1 Tax=Glycomyces tenuis TaxID=58116 RepID=UPI000426E2A6|nr:hypothetical protein [Glycomyces tenuis]
MEAILISVAAAAAGKASEAVVKGGAVAVRKAAELVRARFAGTPELERAERGDIAVEDLAAAIQAACASDEAFRRSLSQAVGRPIGAATFHNEFHGSVKNVFQARTVNELHLN